VHVQSERSTALPYKHVPGMRHDRAANRLDPCQDDQPEPTIHSLSDDLADIYCDLRSGLNALDDGMDPVDVIWEWRFSFTSHWGDHVLEALRALACLATITLWL